MFIPGKTFVRYLPDGRVGVVVQKHDNRCVVSFCSETSPTPVDIWDCIPIVPPFEGGTLIGMRALHDIFGIGLITNETVLSNTLYVTLMRFDGQKICLPVDFFLFMGAIPAKCR